MTEYSRNSAEKLWGPVDPPPATSLLKAQGCIPHWELAHDFVHLWGELLAQGSVSSQGTACSQWLANTGRPGRSP